MAKFRASLDLTSSSNKRYTDEMTFGGVDYATPRLSVAQSHSLDELNYIYQDGVVQKRKGFATYENAKKDFWYVEADITEKITTGSTSAVTLTSTPKELGNAIYNVWNFKDKIIINQSGVLFYTTRGQIAKGEYIPIGRYRGLYTHDNISSPVYEVHKLPAKRLNAYVYGSYMYILTGAYVMVLQAFGSGATFSLSMYSLTESTSIPPYVPTTTIGIIQAEAEVGGTRQTYEQPNMLTDKRINSCVGGVNNKDTTDIRRTFVLDTSASELTDVSISSYTFPFENDYTIADELDDNDKFKDKGFYYPYCGQKAYGAFTYQVTSDADGNFGLIVDDFCFDGLDFSSFEVITHTGEKLSKINYPYLPPVIAQVNRTNVDITPTLDASSGTYDGKTSILYGAPTYAFDTGYYVRIFGFKDETYNSSRYSGEGLSGYMKEISQANFFSSKFEKSCFYSSVDSTGTTYNYYDHYVIVIYAKVNGEIRYCCIPMKIIAITNTTLDKGTMTYEEDTADVVDAMDYFGNSMVVQRYYWENTTVDDENEERLENGHTQCHTTLALLSLVKTTAVSVGMATSLINDNKELYSTAGVIGSKVRFNEDGSETRKSSLIIKSKLILNTTLGTYKATDVSTDFNYRVVGKGAFTGRTGYKLTRATATGSETWIKTSKKYGLLSKIPSLFSDTSSSTTETIVMLVEWYGASGADSVFITSTTKYVKVYGYYERAAGTISSVVLLRDYTPPSIGESNIKFYFRANGYSSQKSDINGCTFGILYGTQNYKNRLFLSGNSKKPTYDWHSGDGNSTDKLDYFPDTSVCHYGTITPVVGYGIVSDGKLLVLKQTSDRESSVYYRTATYSARKDDNGTEITDSTGSAIYEESYPLTQTNSHIGGVEQNLMTDFNGDTLYVDSAGRIVGLDNEGTTYDNQRIATTRSSLIDPKITETFRNLYSENSNCFSLMSYKNDLFYFTPNGTYYTNFDSSYEWFPIELQNVTSWAVVNDLYIFGDINGNIIFYDKNRNAYEDTASYPVSSGSLAVNSDSQLIVSDDIKELIQNKYTTLKLTADETYLYGLIAGSSELKNVDGYLAIKLKQDAEGKNVIKSSNLSLLTNGSKTMRDITVSLLDDISLIEDGYEWYLTSLTYSSDYTSADIYFKGTIDDEYFIESIDSTGNYLTLKINDLYTTSTFSTLSAITTAYVTKEEPVQAYYVTSCYLTGSLGNRKVLDTYTIISDMGNQNEIFVKSITNNVTMDEIIATGGQIDYSKIDFNVVDYTRYDLPHTQTLLGKFYGSFLAFSLKSPNAVNSTLTKINFLYHYAGKTYGKS